MSRSSILASVARRLTILQTLKLQHILMLALLLRVAWALAVPIVPISDSTVYDMLARRIAAGKGYTWPDGTPTVYWAVGASALYALVYALFTQSFLAVSIVNIVMGTLLVAAVHKLALTRFDESVARLAALLAAIWPAWIALTSVLTSELPSNLLLAAGMAAIMSRGYSLLPRVIIGSLLLVMAAYVRPTTLPLIIAVPVLDALVSRQWKAALVGGVLAFAVAAACFAPWTVRNEAHFGKPVLVSANFGVVLWMGNNPQSQGGYMTFPDGIPDDEIARDELLKQQAIEFIKNNPGRYLELCMTRIKASYLRESIAVAWNAEGLPDALELPLKIVMAVYWLGVFGLSLAGFALFVKREPIRILDPMTAAVGLLGSISILVIGSDRYHFGLMPFVSIFAGYALTLLIQYGRASRIDDGGSVVTA